MKVKEVWKPVKGFEGFYEISNYGRVKSKERYVLCKNKPTKIKGKILKFGINSSGYCFVIMVKDNIRKMHLVHRLVAEHFIPNVNNLPQINHIDENKENNHVSNLEWCTAKYNVNYGMRSQKVSEKLRGRYNREDISKKIKQLSKEGMLIHIFPSIREANRAIGKPSRHISECCHHKRKTAYGYRWEFVKE